MDQRLVVTMAFAAYLLGGVMLAIAHSVTEVAFGAGQLEFLALIGYLGPTIAMGLVWVRNYRYGAPLLVGAAGANCWFVLYFFFLHDGPTAVRAVEGDGASAYFYSAVAVVLASLVTAGVGCWLWYRESDGFRSVVDRLLASGGSSG